MLFVLLGRAGTTESIKGGRVLNLQASDFERILAYLTGKPSNNLKALIIMRSCKNFNQRKIWYPYSVPRDDAWDCFKELFFKELGFFKIEDLAELLYRAENYCFY